MNPFIVRFLKSTKSANVFKATFEQKFQVWITGSRYQLRAY